MPGGYGQQPGIILLREGTDTSQGKAQLISNINACGAVVDAVRSTLGPRGMDKLMYDGTKVTISNDGATIMKLLDIVHPAARVLAEISMSQDSEVGDGTTSVVLLAGEMLKQVKPFVEDGLHPQTIARGVRKAVGLISKRLAEVAVDMPPDQRRRRLEILAGTSKGFVYRLRVENMASLLVCENHAAPVKCVSYAAGTSDRFATISSDCTLRIWDAADYSVLTTVCVRDAGEPSCLVYTLDFLISGARAPPRRGERKRRGVPFITRALLKLSPRPRARRLERRQDPRPRIRHRLATVAHRQRAPRRRDGARA